VDETNLLNMNEKIYETKLNSQSYHIQ